MHKDVKSRRESEYPVWYSDIEKPDLPCELSHVIECDEDKINEYRNKVEFTIGRRYEDNEICIGFNKGNISKGIIYVDYPDNIKAISKESIMAAKILETIVKASGLEPYDRMKNEGYWRIVLFRESKSTKEVLVSVVVTEGQNEEI